MLTGPQTRREVRTQWLRLSACNMQVKALRATPEGFARRSFDKAYPLGIGRKSIAEDRPDGAVIRRRKARETSACLIDAKLCVRVDVNFARTDAAKKLGS